MASEAVETVRDKGADKNVSPGQFVAEVQDELKKTSFPSAEDVRNTTVIVILNVIFFAIFLFLVDLAWVFILGDPVDPNKNTGLTWLINKITGS